ncbi:MAG: DNA mismatch repair protein MutS [Spirochaetia bacterium]|nr:DNA mismatch repair protein MutS [Spirochaetia bacterium]
MSNKKITPMMKQYNQIKSKYKDEILFFRLGDFYEMFEEDAEKASTILNVALTSRNGIPMCGIPYHAAKTYIKKLLDADIKIAICEQMEIPEKGIAEREVVQVISPGTVVDEDLLQETQNNYIFSLGVFAETISCAWIDISTGEFTISSLVYDESLTYVKKMLFELDPSEIIIQESFYYDNKHVKNVIKGYKSMVTPYPDWFFSISESFEYLTKLMRTRTLEPFGIKKTDTALFAAGVLVRYIQDNAKFSLKNIHTLKRYQSLDYIQMDESTQKNLEILSSIQNNRKDTLFYVLNHTKSSAGARLLKKWLVQPHKSRKETEKRLKIVDYLYHNQEKLTDVRNLLHHVRDLERLITRVMVHNAAPKDLFFIKESIRYSLSVYRTMCSDASNDETGDTVLISIKQEITEEETDLLRGIADTIEESIYYKPVQEKKEHLLIKPGYNKDLDDLRTFSYDADTIMDEYLSELKETYHIHNLKIKFNKIIGYFIEASKSQIEKIPSDFIRKQTLVNSERYTTEKLIQIESKIEQARKKFIDKEREIFENILEAVSAKNTSILKLSENISRIDCYQSFAYAAIKNGYILPKFSNNSTLYINNGRHPVVEQNLSPGDFVPNSLEIPEDHKRFALITGPNMAGKSTFLRQNALIVLMAYIGSFVPADEAVIGKLDKIFCRVGASDNLAKGESTFLVEMNETAYILNNATEHSLIIMDEVGRGTSTTDGVSLASAVLYYLLELRSKTLFSTHYHELTEINDPMLQKLFLDVYEHEGEIQFLNKVKSGSIQSSYGIHVAKLAGLPSRVIHRAEKTLKKLENFNNSKSNKNFEQAQMELIFDGDLDQQNQENEYYSSIIQELKDLNLNETSPVQALVFLDRVKKKMNQK